MFLSLFSTNFVLQLLASNMCQEEAAHARLRKPHIGTHKMRRLATPLQRHIEISEDHITHYYVVSLPNNSLEPRTIVWPNLASCSFAHYKN